MKRDADGLEYLEIGGVPSKRTRKGYPATLGRMGQKDLDAFKPHPDKTHAANMPYGACNAEERLKLLDAEGLDAAGVRLLRSTLHCACLETSRPALSGAMSGAPGKASEA
jgi:hypothetical protein